MINPFIIKGNAYIVDIIKELKKIVASKTMIY